jgi:hypothetical protein
MTAAMPPRRPTPSAPSAQSVPVRSMFRTLSSDQLPAPTPASANSAATSARLNSKPWLVLKNPFLR